jgi:hypothetical protein
LEKKRVSMSPFDKWKGICGRIFLATMLKEGHDEAIGTG